MTAALLVPIAGTTLGGIILAIVTWLLNRSKVGTDKAKAITEAGVLVLDQVQEERDRLDRRLTEKTEEHKLLRRDFWTVRNLLAAALDLLRSHGEDVSTQRAILDAIDERN